MGARMPEATAMATVAEPMDTRTAAASAQASSSGGMCAPIANVTAACAAPEARRTPLKSSRRGQNHQRPGDGAEGIRSEPAQAAADAVRRLLHPAAQSHQSDQRGDHHGHIGITGEMQGTIEQAAEWR